MSVNINEKSTLAPLLNGGTVVPHWQSAQEDNGQARVGLSCILS